MITTQFVCRLGALLALVAVTVAAQTNVNWNAVKALSAGTDVRVMAGPRTVSGKIDRVTDDTLVVTSGKGPEMLTQQEITRVSVRKKGHRGRNALIGLAIGAGAGLATLAAPRPRPNLAPDLSNLVTAVLTVVGAVVGTLVGAVIPTGGWREIYKK